MHARHTQVRLQCRAITSKALVNRARMKVVKIALIKTFVIPGCASWRRPGIHNPESWLWIPGSPLRGAPE